jgi:cytochrome P450
MLWASANFDDQEFENPNELELTRVNNRHMTFGRGIHRCLGSHLALARLEMRIILQQVFRRLPDFEMMSLGFAYTPTSPSSSGTMRSRRGFRLARRSRPNDGRA